jgi:hypothetical protein
MALFEDVLKGNLGTGLAVGVGVLVAPAVLSAVAHMLRPAARTLIKGGIVLYEDARGAVAEEPARAEEPPHRGEVTVAAPRPVDAAGNKPRPSKSRTEPTVPSSKRPRGKGRARKKAR